jgi:phosphoglycolate phosphatase
MKLQNLRADAICFDKDGTLFDFAKTWNVWTGQVIADLSAGDPVLAGLIAAACGYDLGTGTILTGSPIIAATNRQVAEAMASALPNANVDDVERHLMVTAANAPLAPAVPLKPFLADLARLGLALGVMTNDTEFGARAHLRKAGVLDQFDFVAGFDSGHGAKPSPDPLLAFCAAVSSAPARAVMVGDSGHDLVAGRAAGMQTVGVLTGLARQSDLAPYADVVLPDIGHLKAWLAS